MISGSRESDLPARPLVSIIVPFLNEEAYLPCCLEALAGQTYPRERMEIIAVDGGSTDSSPRIVEEFARHSAEIHLVQNPRRNAASGLNIGRRLARGEYILRVDAHCVITATYVADCVNLLATRSELGDVGGPLRPIGETCFGKGIALALTSPFSMGGSPFRYARRAGAVDTVYLGAYRRRDLDRVGWFDESLNANEDYEFNYRLRSFGFVIWCEPLIRSNTFTRRTPGGLVQQYVRYGFWKARMASKHPRSLKLRHLAAPIFLVFSVLGLLLVVGGQWALSLALGGGYTAANLWFSWRAGWPRAGRCSWWLPIVFATLHLCWGAGFLAGAAMTIAKACWTYLYRARSGASG